MRLTNQTNFLFLFLMTLALCLVVSCKSREIDPQPTESPEHTYWRNSIDSVLSIGSELIQGKLRAVEPKETRYDITEGGKPVVEHKGSDSYDVVRPGYYRKIRRIFDFYGYRTDDDYIPKLSEEAIWPGNIIHVKSLKSSQIESLRELNEYRCPGRVTMAVVNGSRDLTRELTDFRFSEVTKQINSLVAANEGELPANLEYSIHTVRTLGEAAYYLRVPQSELENGKKYKEFRAVRWTDNTLKFILTFRQKFFTLVYDTPETGSALFKPSLTAEKLSSYTGKGDPLGYVSSVTYGRRFVALVEETRRTYSDSTELKQILEKQLPSGDRIKNIGRKVLDKLPNTKQTLRNVRIYLHLEGGRDIFTTDVSMLPSMAELNKFLISTATGAHIRYGIPITCTIKYLKNLKTVIIPHKMEGRYSFDDYEPEEDDNKIIISGLRLEGKGAGKYAEPGANYDEISNRSSVHIKHIQVSYSTDNKEENVIDVAARLRDYPQSYQDGFTHYFPNIELPAFGKTPVGHIRLSINLLYKTVRYAGGYEYDPPQDIVRSIEFRYSPTRGWFIEDDGKVSAVDAPFQRLGYKGSHRFCPIEFTLHYHLSTQLKGSLNE